MKSSKPRLTLSTRLAIWYEIRDGVDDRQGRTVVAAPVAEHAGWVGPDELARFGRKPVSIRGGREGLGREGEQVQGNEVASSGDAARFSFLLSVRLSPGFRTF
jgi:hypothetical protein